MIKLRDLITEGGNGILEPIQKAKSQRDAMNYVKKFLKDEKSYGGDFGDIKNIKFVGNVSSEDKLDKMIKLKDLITEGKITSDVDRAAKKHGIKFKKKVKTVFTNDFTGVNEPGEKVKYDDWMEYNPQNYKSQGMGLVSELMGKYILVKNNRSTNGASAVFINRKKDPKSRFTITYSHSFSGAYISYTGVKGQ